jgi:hypothetical protein
MSYKSQVLKDNPLAFWPLEESSGTTIADRSPSGNNGSYSTTITDSKEMPLAYGISRAFKNKNQTITFNMSKNNNRSLETLLLSSDNGFSLETWLYPSIGTAGRVSIISNDLEDMGIFYDSGTIFFSVYGEEIKYTIPHINESLHIVATYEPSRISLYIDGSMASFLTITPFNFSKEEETLKSGPTANSTDFYLINGVAVYRYVLNQSQALSHYDAGQSLFPVQIVNPHGGEIFEFYDDNVSTQFNYSYPANKSWDYFITDGLSYDPVYNKLYIPVGAGESKTIEITDVISIPTGPSITDSKIEWNGDNGISVETSIDGINYTSCINGQSIPGYQIGSEIVAGALSIKITFTTDDDSKYNPELNYLSMTFYKNQITYASNSSSYLNIIDPPITIGDPVIINVSMSNYKYPILSRHDRNGIKALINSGFNINTVSEINTIEFFYTPTSLVGNILFDATSASYGSTALSAVSSVGITQVLVNGVDRTSQTSIVNVLEVNKLHHLVFRLTSPVSGTIRFHDSEQASGLYQNISLYSKQLSQADAVENYAFYTNPTYQTVLDSAITMTENDLETYDNDWIVIQNT